MRPKRCGGQRHATLRLWIAGGRADLISRMEICFPIDTMEPEWAVRSRKNAWVFARETLVYGFIIFVLLAGIRGISVLRVASSRFGLSAHLYLLRCSMP